MKKKISLDVECPHCLASLMDSNTKLQGFPSIKINVVTPSDRGVLNICSVYECYEQKTNLDIKDNTIVDFYCPHCNKELLIKDECNICAAPMVSFVIKVGGKVNICSRKGCSNHYVAFNDLSTELTKFYSQFGD